MRFLRPLALAGVLTLSSLGGSLGLAPPGAHAAASVTVAMTSDPDLTLDSNTPCTAGPNGAYVEFTVANSTASALSSLTVTLSGFTTGFSLSGGDVATRQIASLGAGASVNEYFYVTYPCTKPPSSGFGTTDTLSAAVTDGNGNTLGSGTGTVGTYGAISANAGGSLTSETIAAATYQQVEMDVEYSFGSIGSGAYFDLQPAGNPSTSTSSDFNAGCFRLVGAKILSSQVNAVPAGGTAIYYQASSGQGGSNNLVTVAYYFQPQCVGVATTAFPYAMETSGSTNVKYSGNYGITVSVPATVANTSVGVTTSGTPSVYGQSVTFTATITRTPASGSAGGTATFVADSGTANATTLCSNAAVTAGVATCSYSTLPVGTHTITVNYAGDTNDAAATGTLSGGQTVNQAATTTILTSSVNPSVFGQSVTFTATVSANAPGSGNPTGTVTFYDNGASLGTGTLATSNGATTATLITSSLAVGSHPLTASYGGDANFSASSATGSQTVSQAVNQAQSTTTVSTSANPITVGQSVTFTATVSVNNPGTGNPTGTVTFYDNGTSIGTGTLSTTGGVTTATLSTSSLAIGTHPITASYGGDTNVVGSSDNVGVSEVVQGLDTTTTLSPSPSSTITGHSVLLTATVAPAASTSSSPTGTVTFYDGTTQLGTGTLSTTGGVTTATLYTSFSTTGTHPLKAVYGGDGTFNGSSGTSSESVSTVTMAIVSRFTVRASHNGTTFHWRVSTSHGVAGFVITAGGASLTRGLIPVHGSLVYRYKVHGRQDGPYTLRIILDNGTTASITAG